MTDWERNTNIATLTLMRNDLHWLVMHATAGDRRRVDRHQLAAIDYALDQLQSSVAMHVAPTVAQAISAHCARMRALVPVLISRGMAETASTLLTAIDDLMVVIE